MKYSLVSREVIADSIETVVGAEGLRRLGGHRRLRQEHAGLRDGMARLNRPAVFVYGGTIMPGIWQASRGHRLGVRGGGAACGREA